MQLRLLLRNSRQLGQVSEQAPKGAKDIVVELDLLGQARRFFALAALGLLRTSPFCPLNTAARGGEVLRMTVPRL
jgi:hypothetical protein